MANPVLILTPLAQERRSTATLSTGFEDCRECSWRNSSPNSRVRDKQGKVPQQNGAFRIVNLVSVIFPFSEFIQQEQYMESTPCFNRALKIRLHLVGEMHPEVAKIRWWFAEALKAQGHERESRQQWQQALEIYRAKNLMTHPNYKKCLALWE